VRTWLGTILPTIGRLSICSFWLTTIRKEVFGTTKIFVCLDVQRILLEFILAKGSNVIWQIIFTHNLAPTEKRSRNMLTGQTTKEQYKKNDGEYVYIKPLYQKYAEV